MGFHDEINRVRRSTIPQKKYEKDLQYNAWNIIKKGKSKHNLVLFFQKHAKGLKALENINLPIEFDVQKLIKDILKTGEISPNNTHMLTTRLINMIEQMKQRKEFKNFKMFKELNNFIGELNEIANAKNESEILKKYKIPDHFKPMK